MAFKCVLFLLSFPLTGGLERINIFIVKVDVLFKEHIKEVLISDTFSLLYEIPPDTLVVDYNVTKGRGADTLESLSLKYPDKILHWEQMSIFENTTEPAYVVDNSLQQSDSGGINENYYGMDIRVVWRQGFTGKGIVIAIADVGIDVDLLDLNKNVNNHLGYNFVKNNNNVTPEYFSNDQVSPSEFSDHGNRVASIIAAEQGNNICADGIAYNSTIAAYKVFDVKHTRDMLHFESLYFTRADIIAKALVHNLNEIDIFVSAWSPIAQFDRLDLLVSEAIEVSAFKGRRSLGIIHLVPAGPVGNGLSNNIYTITVGSIGQFGSVPSYAFIDASVITSGLGDGSNLTADKMVTTSYQNKCITSFVGISAATAQIAGIIALGLEANPYMSLRDIQRLLILASDHEGLNDSIAFRQNGANRHVHGVFGYGLLNADKFVKLAAANKRPLPNLLNVTLHMKSHQKVSPLREEFEACFDCPSVKTGDCLISVEQVVIFVSFNITTKNLQMEVISPDGTQSVLVDEKYEDHKAWEVEHGKLVSTHFWDEKSIGVWKVIIQHKHLNDFVQINNVSITIFGTYRTKYTRLENIDLCSNKLVTTEQSNIPKPEIIIVDYDKNTEDNSTIISFVILSVIIVVIIVGIIILIYFGGPQGPLAHDNTLDRTSMALLKVRSAPNLNSNCIVLHSHYPKTVGHLSMPQQLDFNVFNSSFRTDSNRQSSKVRTKERK